MILNEKTKTSVETLAESFNVSAEVTSDILESLESCEVEMPEKYLGTYVKMYNLQEKLLAESNDASDIAVYTKKVQPLLRRIMPNQLIMEICDVQVVDSPSSAVFGLRSKYAGSQDAPVANDAVVLAISGSASDAVAVGDTLTGVTSTAVGEVAYVETGKVIVNVTSGTFQAGEVVKTDVTADAVYSSETAFRQVLKNYTGPHATADGEKLGTDMNQVKTTIVKMSVNATTRKLKAQFTTELVQDMQSMFGANAEDELMNILAHEIGMEIDREAIEKYKSIATVNPNFAVATTTHSQGRWSQEMYAGLFQKILRLSNGLAQKNKRGKGNILVTTAGPISALESLGQFRTTDYASGVTVSENPGQVYVGTLKTGMKVYQDLFSDTEYCMVIYKGSTAFDSGLIYAPYKSLWFERATDADTFQPAIGAMTRYDLVVNEILDDASGSNYAEYFEVDFVNTPMQ